MRHRITAFRMRISVVLALFLLINFPCKNVISLANSPETLIASEGSHERGLIRDANNFLAPRLGNSKVDSNTQSRVIESYGRLPATFEMNQGQIDARVKFLSRRSNSALFLTATDARLVLQKRDKSGKGSSAALRFKFAGGNPEALLEGADQNPGTSNYFIGNDPSRWRPNVPNYQRVLYRSLYPGIDLVFYGNSNGVEFDFNVAPGAQPEQIRLFIQGAKRFRIDASGELVMRTNAGDVRQHKPNVYQVLDGTRRTINSRYVFKGKRSLGFEIGEYDKSKPLVIDPVLDYGTFLGGTGSDEGRGIALDSNGNAHVVGRTTSFNFPVTIDAYNTTYQNSFDVFVTKMNAAGTALVYSTYIGGQSDDSGFGISLDGNGNAYVVGSTSSTGFPTTPGSLQPMIAGNTDAFVTKLNSTGTALIYSTFLGGTGSDQAAAIALDSALNAYVTGSSGSTNFPTTPGAFQTANAGGGNNVVDAFVTKLNDTGTAMVYSTYVGGTRGDVGASIAVDPLGQAFVSGSTNSIDFDVTAGALQTAFGGSSSSSQFSTIGDAFLTKLNDSGTGLIYSTYVGGSGDDSGLSVAVNPSGEAFICGASASFNFPVTSGVVKVSNGGAIRSDDAASSWSAANNGLTDSTVLATAVDSATPGTVFLGTNQRGVFKSTDGGLHWTPKNAGLTTLTIRCLAVDPTSSSIVYLGTNSRGVFKSSDGGDTWRAINTGQGGSAVNAIVIDPSNPAVLYAGTESGVFKSTNGGASWTAVNNGINNTFIQTLAIDPVMPTILYAGTSFSGVFITKTGGQNWDPSTLNNGVIRALQVDPVNDSVVYAGGDNGVFKSTDFGVSWRSRSIGLSSRSINALAIVPQNPSVLYAGTARGMARSTNAGDAWSEANNNIAGTFINSVVLDPVTPSKIIAGMTFGLNDGYVAKLNASGSTLVYSTFLGGNSPDSANAIAIDTADKVFVAGQTNSTNFPTTSGTYFQNAGSDDAFVTKLNATVTEFTYSTLLGGFNTDQGFDVAADSTGHAYVTGLTNSSNFPVTPGAFQALLGGVNNNFSQDAFLVKINQTPVLSADLRVTITGPNFPVSPNTFFSYNITITNDGPEAAFLITLTDELPATLNFNGCSSQFGCSASGNIVTVPINSLASGAAANVNLFVFGNCSIVDGATITNTVSIESQTPDPNTANNVASVVSQASRPAVQISPTQAVFPITGGSGSVQVFPNDSCPWTAVSNATWINVTSGGGGSGFGIVNYTVAPNPGPLRGDTITIAGKAFSVIQSGLIPQMNIGVYNPGDQTFYLRNSNSMGFADLVIPFGPFGAIPIVGDWDGNGSTTIGVYEPLTRTFYLRNSNNPGFADITVQFGPAGAVPIVGDWNSDGITTIGAYDPATQTFYLRDSNTPGPADATFQFGPPGAVPLAGDWDGNGTTTIGAYDPATGVFYLRNANAGGFANLTIPYGPPGVKPVVADWDGNGTVSIGVYDPATQIFYLRNSNSPGFADITIRYGPPGAIPLGGDWNGL